MSRWTPELLESKVLELLEEETGGPMPPLVERSTLVYTPAPSQVSGPRKLSRQQESALVNRLYQPRRQVPVLPPPQTSTPKYMSAKSAELTRGLEPINLRSDKLIEARQRRLERMQLERQAEERKVATGQPTISEKSRMIAERLTPERRQQMVELRRAILMQEAIEREKENCVFHPVINPVKRRGSFSVTDRLVRDADGRRERQLQLQAERERLEVSELRETPEITSKGKMMLGGHVHERLYPRSPPRSKSVERTRVVPFNEFWMHQSQEQTPRRLDISNLFDRQSRIFN